MVPASNRGSVLPWYRVNGWIMQSGGPDWLRYQFHLLGFTLLRTPWVYTGLVIPSFVEPVAPPQAVDKRWPW